MDDPYYKRREIAQIRAAIQRDPRVAETDRGPFLDFLTDASVQGLSDSRVLKYAQTLRLISRDFGGPVTAATEGSVREFARQIEALELSDWSRRDRKVVLKCFLRWHRKTAPDYPPEIAWLKVRTRRTSTKLPEDLLTQDEVSRLVRAAENPRDRAIIALLYETGMRVGELLGMRVGSVRPTEHGAVVTVRGKTGSRRMLVISSMPLLNDWLSAHPRGNEPDAPLWINTCPKNHGRQMYYMAVQRLVQVTGQRAGIRKRVHPHLFRHSRASHLATRFTEAQMKQFFGWTQGSAMASVYVHLSGRDVDSAVLALHGIRQTKEEGPIDRKPACPRCRADVLPTQASCPNCWLELSARPAPEPVQPGGATRDAIALIERLLENPKFVELLAEEKARAERERRDPRAVWPKSGPPHAA